MALKDHLFFWSFVVGVFLLDRISKLLVLDFIPLDSSIGLFPFLSFTHIVNKGTLFGLFQDAGLFFMLFALVVSIYVIVVYRRYDRAMQLSLALVLAGALGNLVDRVLYGHVIDFIDVHFWPVFNIADSAIVIAVVLLLFRGAFDHKQRNL